MLFQISLTGKTFIAKFTSKVVCHFGRISANEDIMHVRKNGTIIQNDNSKVFQLFAITTTNTPNLIPTLCDQIGIVFHDLPNGI